jgi:hypothetical protein
MITLVATDVVYFSQNDEAAFFEWMGKNRAITSFRGVGSDLFIEFSAEASEENIRDIIALFHRYNISMPQLAKLSTKRNSKWFNNKGNYWHDLVFGAPA